MKHKRNKEEEEENKINEIHLPFILYVELRLASKIPLNLYLFPFESVPFTVNREINSILVLATVFNSYHWHTVQ